jgi:hypothetical protein
MPLLSRDDSLLVVIDMQPCFWGDHLDTDEVLCAEQAASRAAWLAAVASACVRTLQATRDFERANPQLASPPGFSL